MNSANIMIASPGSVNTVPRPEEQTYLEKLKNLQKYVEPIKKMIEKIDKDDRFVARLFYYYYLIISILCLDLQMTRKKRLIK